MQNKNIENEQSITKTEKKGFFSKRKIGAAVFTVAAAIVAGNHIPGDKPDAPRFLNTPTTEQASIMTAPNSVIPGVQIEQEPVAELKGPYVEASHSVELPADTTNIDPNSTKEYWEHFEERHRAESPVDHSAEK